MSTCLTVTLERFHVAVRPEPEIAKLIFFKGIKPTMGQSTPLRVGEERVGPAGLTLLTCSGAP